MQTSVDKHHNDELTKDNPMKLEKGLISTIQMGITHVIHGIALISLFLRIQLIIPKRRDKVCRKKKGKMNAPIRTNHKNIGIAELLLVLQVNSIKESNV